MEKERLETSKIKLVNIGKLFQYKDFYPKIHSSVFLAVGVKVIGDVEIGNDSSVWYNTVIHGDVHYIKIGILPMFRIVACFMLLTVDIL
jgi:serine acetyltransferase